MIWLFLAQLAIAPVPDATSYLTAAVNPAVAVVEAWRSPDRACRFGQLAISEAVGNGTALALKHVLVSPRPCAGCAPDGMPSGHTMNSAIGFSRWRYGIAFHCGDGRVTCGGAPTYGAPSARGRSNWA